MPTFEERLTDEINEGLRELRSTLDALALRSATNATLIKLKRLIDRTNEEASHILDATDQ